MSTPTDNSGGPVAIRGFLVQTLVALLDIARADPPFTEITLEPAIGDEQFDFLWKDATGSHATQVKSTVNSFGKSDVEKWAAKLEAARSNEECRLVLVGIVPPSLDGLKHVGKVAIEKKNLHLDDLREQAAQRLALFLESENQHAGTAVEREMIVHALVSKLEHLSTKSEPLTRATFVLQLTQWIRSAPIGPVPIDISRISKYAPAELIGRDDELSVLSVAWDQAQNHESKRPHVLTFVALGGEGKTSLVAKWVADLAHQDWPGCEAVFAWSFYSQGSREQAAVSSDLFLAAALRFFGDAEMADSAQGAFDKGRRLAQLVGQRRALLVLDGLEPLQYPPGPPLHGKLKDEGLAALLKGLAANSKGLCVVTTRYSIPDLKMFWQTTAPERPLLRLSTPAGVALLKSLDVQGTPSEFEQLVEDVRGHALTLNLLGSYLRDAHGGDIRRRDLVTLEEADAEEQGGHAFRVLDAYVQSFETGGETADARAKNQQALALLQLMGFFDRPATPDCLQALWSGEPIAGLTEPQRNMALKRLEAARLLTVNRNAAGELVSLDAHPLIREYFAAKVTRSVSEGERENDADASSPSLTLRVTSAWRAAHERLYRHLCATPPDKPDATLEDLQPLYQAVAHGCQAGLQQEACDKVYFARIMRGNEYYSSKKLGALGSSLGAVACFFEKPWSRVSPSLTEADQAWLLNETAYYLRGLGRLTEALEPMRVSGEMDVKVEEWEGAAISYSNLSELELTLGEVAGAVGDASRSVTYADRSGDADWPRLSRITEADALHQAGRRAEAEALFREAELMQAERQPDYPLLYSLQGFKYCDLLLAAAERAAFLDCGSLLPLSATQPAASAGGQTTDEPSGSRDVVSRPDASRLAGESGSRLPQSKGLRDVSQRATQTLKWVESWQMDILSASLDHLTLGRAVLYAAVLSSDSAALASFLLPTSHLQQSVSGLRRAGQQFMLPHALLTRAWLRSLTSAWTGPESAQSDLDEAWEIAARGPMPLFLADIHLYRARLFGRGGGEEEGIHSSPPLLLTSSPSYPWQSPQHDLAEARRLIEKHGYGRRMDELEDAETALRKSGGA